MAIFRNLLLPFAGLLLVLPVFSQNNGLYLARTEHEFGGVSGALVQKGGIAQIRMPYEESAVTFWMHRLRGNDNTSKDDPVNRGGTRFLSARQIGRSHDNGITAPEILANDDKWHYHLVKFTPQAGGMRIDQYLDGRPTPSSGRDTSITGEFYMILGADVILATVGNETTQFKHSTDANVVIDDLTVWSGTDQSIFDNYTTVADFGMSRFDSENAAITHYYDFNTAQKSTEYVEDVVIKTTGTEPANSTYTFGLPPGGVPLHDASSARKRKIEVTVSTSYGEATVSPVEGTTIFDYDSSNTTFIDFSAPEFIYLDRYGKELGSSESTDLTTFLDEAYYRARNLGYAVRRGGRIDTTGTERFFSQPQTENIDITWNWELEYAVFIDSATDAYEGLSDSLGNPSLSQNGANAPTTISRHWIKAGTSLNAAIAGIIFPEGDGAQGNISFRSTGYSIEQEASDSGTDRFLTLSNADDHLRANSPDLQFGTGKSFTLEFWARRNEADIGHNSSILAIGDMSVGFTTDERLRFGSHDDLTTRLTVNVGTEWRHWSYQYDESSQLQKIHIDGIEVSSSTEDSANWDFSGIDNIIVGGSLNASDQFTLSFLGDINNIRLWNKALTEDEIGESMGTAAFGNQSGLSLELTFDEDVETGFGLAAGFLKSLQYMNVLGEPTFHANYTMEARLLFPLPDTGNGNIVFFDGLSSPISIGPDGVLYSWSNNSSDSSGFDTDALAAGWHRFSAVVQGSSITHYVDGVEVGTTDTPVLPGLTWLGSGAENTQPGWMDDVRVWNEVRTEAQIADSWSRPLTDNEIANEGNLFLYYTFDDGTGKNIAGSAHNGTFSGGASVALAPNGSSFKYLMRSSEGNGISFGLTNFDSLFANSLFADPDDPTTWWEILFPHLTTSTHTPGPQVNTGSQTVDDWLRVTWNWERSYRLEVEVNDNQFADLPFIITENETYLGVDNMANVWVSDLSEITVGTIYRSEDACFTLDAESGLSAQLHAFRDVTVDSVVDGMINGKVTRQYTFDAITGAGTLLFTYTPTVYRAQIALGKGLDASTPAAVEAQLVPDLCGISPQLAQTGPTQVIAPTPANGATASGESWVWDQLTQTFYPLAPGYFTLTWPDELLPAITYQIEVRAEFPDDTVTLSNLEADDGSRIEPGIPYETDFTYPGVPDTFPASPVAHYTYLFSTDSTRTPPVSLDPSGDDRWAFQRTPYSEDAGMNTNANTQSFSSTAAGRAVMLFSYRPDPDEAANGDASRESFAPRIVLSSPLEEHAQDESAISLANGQRSSARFTSENGLYGAIAPNGGNYSIGSTDRRTWDSWLRFNEFTDESPDADRIAFQIDVGNHDLLIQFGLRSKSHPINPGGYFLSQEAYENGDASQAFSVEMNEVAVDTDWHHWTLVFESDGILFYQDGVVVNELDGNPFNFVGQNSNNFHSYGYSANEPDSWMEGELDSVRFWGEALTTAQIRQIMRSRPKAGDGLVAHYSNSFDNGTSGHSLSQDTDLNYPANGELETRDSGGGLAEALRILVRNSSDFFPEVATRIRSKLDTADLGSGFSVNAISNYNPHIYRRGAAAGEWGPIYPVNWAGLFTSDTRRLEVVYYENPYLALPDSDEVLHPDVAWPYISVSYNNVDYPAFGEHKDKVVYIASRLGTEGVTVTGDEQPVYDPAGVANLAIYQQPDESRAGYNPNEEHAVVAPSIKALLVGDPTLDLGQDAAFALQNELNRNDRSQLDSYSSDPWILVEFDDLASGEIAMAAYKVEQTRDGAELFPALDPETHLPTDALGQAVPQPADPNYQFEYSTFAGDLVTQPYPLNVVVGNVVMPEDDGADSFDLGSGLFQRTLWFDKNHNGWIVSGESQFVHRFWYPMRDDFWFDPLKGNPNTGDPIAWVPNNGNYLISESPYPEPQVVVFDTYWKEDYPVLKPGESMTYVGGENKADNPLEEGLPGIVGWKSGQVVFDSGTPSMYLDELADLKNYSARITRPLDAYQFPFEQSVFSSLLNGNGDPLTPASEDRVHVVGSRWYFKELTGSLQKRFYFDSLIGELVFRGRLNNLESGDPDLTVTPISLSILEPNVMSPEDYEAMTQLGEGNEEWENVVEELYLRAQNPEEVEAIFADNQVAPQNPASVGDQVYLSGIGSESEIDQSIATQTNGIWKFTTKITTTGFTPLDSLGSGAALVPNPSLISEASERKLYVTLVENNHEKVAGAVTLHIIRIGEERFRGAIKVVEAQNVFDEKINLRHSADFGGNVEEAYYQWWVRDVANLDDIQLPGEEVEWQLYDQGLGLNQIEFSGRPDVLISDKLFYVRYGEKEELDAITGNDTENGVVGDSSWRLVDPNSFDDTYDVETGDPIPYQWAGAFNSPQARADGSVRFLPQLVMGWVKRVLDRVNPYEARFSETFSDNAPATFSSMLQQAGKPYIGPVALNSDKDVIENVGLIELYETVLARARELTLEVPGVPDSGTNQALLLAATRLTILYELLGSEAYADAQNPSLPVTDEQGLPIPAENGLATANPYTHAFQDQVSSLLQEELALLRGTDFLKAYPAYNRLFWNYVKGLGEAAYNINYRIVDITEDGLINEFDAAQLYPQGHGDAWGHYLSANKMHYALLRHQAFDWEARAELYSLLDNVLETDFIDEKTFVRIAASKARAGAEIVSNTYRVAYTDDPDGQWQGYTDTVDPARAWGVSEWAKRAGQGALFDWMVGNAMVPDKAEEGEENLDRIDRIANQLELGEVAGALHQIQNTLDQSNSGANPIGMNQDALVFDTDSFYNGETWERRTHFEQIWDRAVASSQNALTSLGYASRANLQINRTIEDTRDLQIQALGQDYDYRNRLIDIFGTPYEGTIGPGRIFADGYVGPDTLLYMYIDRVTTKGLEVQADSRYLEFEAWYAKQARNFSDLNLDPTLGGGNTEGINSLFKELYLSTEFPELVLESTEGESLDGEEDPDEKIITISAPVLETSEFAFQVPDENDDGVPDWGRRGAYGSIQLTLNKMLAAENARDIAVDDYNDYLKKLIVLQKKVRLELKRVEAKEKSRLAATATIPELEALILLSDIYLEGFETLSNVARNKGIAAAALFPFVTGVAAGDPFAQARGWTRSLSFVISEELESQEKLWKTLKFSLEQAVGVIERLAEFDEHRLEDYGELIDLLAEFSVEVQEEGNIRLRITQSIQQVEILARQVKALEAEGLRLLDARAAFNMVLASSAQKNRYKDMITRLTRNDALGKYQNSFESAQRYAWLAAKAYDYETSLAPGDPASATSFLEKIVKERQLGLWENGEPQTGNGGLAEILAQMKANFEVLRGQLGINNPQNETGQLSMRKEHFRILTGSSSSDTRWQQALLGARVDNLWDVPEFRRYCRPFAAESAGAQPGLVIEFSTSINPGENVFGRPLAGGDNAYSTANFSTKIAAVGSWFEGYNDASLSTTPRIYLVPVGSDQLRIANADEPEVRSWDIIEQRIPVPYTLNTEELTAPGFIPSIDGLNGSFDEIKRFGDFRAYHTNDGFGFDTSQLTTDSRLIGRSVWNTRWLLIIPGATLAADPEEGLDDFVDGVTDIKLFFKTYSNPGN